MQENEYNQRKKEMLGKLAEKKIKKSIQIPKENAALLLFEGSNGCLLAG